ncbi:hypothetical protein Aduo_019090 [Ancylostoma duodenale]
MLDASENSPLITLTRGDEEPVRIQFDYLIKFENVIKFVSEAAYRIETIPQLLIFVAPAHSNSRVNNCDADRPGTLSDIIPNAPIPDWILASTFELHRALTILLQTHLPEPALRDLLLDTDYITMSPTGLAVAYAHLRMGCMHTGAFLRGARKEQITDHPSRHREDPFDIALIAEEKLT